MSLYELLLFIHVLAAAAWFGAALLSLVLVELAARAGDRGYVLKLGEYEERVANLLFISCVAHRARRRDRARL